MTTDEAGRLMKAVVIHEAGGPEALKIEDRPIPVARTGWVLVRVKAFGINRSEMFTRQGLSPDVRFPRILGIEAVGVVESAPGGEFAPGTTVATVMGGMGRDFDGGYAQYLIVPANQVKALKTTLPWATLGALPEMLQTAWGSLYEALQLKSGDTLLIRGGTTSVGLAAAAIASHRGATVYSTTRKPDREALLRSSGASDVFIDDGEIAAEVRSGVIPTAVYLTTYDGGVAEFMSMPLQELLDQVSAGQLRVQIGKVFVIDEIVEAHKLLDSNAAGGKIVVLTD